MADMCLGGATMCGVSHGDRVEGRENWAVLCGGALSGFFLSVVNYKFIEMVHINDQASLFQCYFFKKLDLLMVFF